jgi:hypothetical protein
MSAWLNALAWIVIVFAAWWLISAAAGLFVGLLGRRLARMPARLTDREWAQFAAEHELFVGDHCGCSLWDAEGDRPVIRVCDQHKETQ